MAKREMSGNKRSEIIKAAQKLFFESGYDATSIRSIMREAGGEVALFYYYFKGKDEVFDAVLDEFFQQYLEEADKVFEKWKRNPYRMMSEFFTAMIRKAEEFSQQYSKKLHRTILWTIRNYTMYMIEPYVKKMINVLVQYGAKPVTKVDIVSRFIMNGVGSIILSGNYDEIWENYKEVRKCTNSLLGLDPETASMMFPIEIQNLRIGDCIAFFNEHRECTPWLERDTFINEVSLRAAEHGVLAVEAGEMKLAGLICFSRKTMEVTYFVVDKNYFDGLVFQCLLVSAMAEMKEGEELAVYIGDPTVTDSSMLYDRLCLAGFEDAGIQEKEGGGCKVMKSRNEFLSAWRG